ncbi:MAG: AAA family ATPase [Myxococcota bacterium]
MICPDCGRESPAGARFCAYCGSALAAGVGPVTLGEGRYVVDHLIGEGSRKRVFLARDTALERDIALALIKEEGLGRDGLARVRREVRAMGELGDHPNIVTIHDIGEENGQLYIVSEYLPGGSLETLLANADAHRLTPPRAMRIAEETARALAHAHGHGIIHRDLKPGNIWLAEDGTARLGDFGLAISVEQTRLSQEGLIIGTVAYMAPEQALGRGAEARSDLYALGAVLYEMITGRPVFSGDGVLAIISQHVNSTPVDPGLLEPAIPVPLAKLILSLLEKDPARRPASAQEVAEILHAMRTAAVPPQPCAEAAGGHPLDRLAAGIFVGRDEEVRRLRQGLDESLAGRGGMLLLVGEPGIGKTRTAEELVTYARLRGADVLWGRCYEGEGAPAFWPWVQILRESLGEDDDEGLRDRLGAGASDLVEILPELHSRLPDIPPAPELDAEAARFRLFDAVARFLLSLARDRPRVIVIDDLHWADESSLLLLRFLAREIRKARVLLLGTYRDVELKRGHPLSQTLATLAREGISRRIVLRGLSHSDVSRYLEMALCGPPPAGLAAAIHAETEGNPFFVQEVVRLLVSEGRLDARHEEGEWKLAIPEGVREVIGRRLDQLSSESNELLGVASVIGREFDLTLLEGVSGIERAVLLEALEEARAARVLAEGAGVLGRYRFAHALVRETLYEELSTPRRVRLHQRVGEVLERLPTETRERRLAEMAHHFFQSIQAGQVEKAVGYAVAAAEHAVRQRAFQEAITHYDHALQAIEFQDPPDEARRLELLLALGEARRAAGLHPAGRESFAQAAELAGRLGATDALAEAAIGYARTIPFGSGDARAVALLKEALGALEGRESAACARLLGLLGLTLRWTEGRERAEELASRAVAMARRVNDPRTLGHELDVLHILSDPLQDPHTRLEVPREMIAVAQSIGDAELHFAGRVHLIVDLFEIGDLDAVVREADALDALVTVLRQPIREISATRIRAAAALARGELTRADQLLAQSGELMGRIDAATVERFSALQEAILHLLRGDPEAGIQGLEKLLAVDPLARPGVVLALLLAEASRDDEARRELARTREEERREGARIAGFFNECLMARACVRLGDVRVAEELYTRLQDHGDRFAHAFFFLFLGSVQGYLGLLATLLGRWELAERHLQAALRANRQCGAAPFVAYAAYDYAQLCLARDDPGDRERALSQVNDALELAREVGMRGLVEKSLALKLQLQGIRPGLTPDGSLEGSSAGLDAAARELAGPEGSEATVTLMFSDMEGFSTMTERLGDAAALEVTRAHNAIVRRALAAHGGYEVELRGDGFLLAFSRAAPALACAIAIQRSFARYGAEHPDQPIRVRIGLHTGEALQDANKLFGRTVILAARIAEQARAGEILVSSVLRDHVRSQESYVFDAGRDLTLKGLSGTHRVYTAAWS